MDEYNPTLGETKPQREPKEETKKPTYKEKPIAKAAPLGRNDGPITKRTGSDNSESSLLKGSKLDVNGYQKGKSKSGQVAHNDELATMAPRNGDNNGKGLYEFDYGPEDYEEIDWETDDSVTANAKCK